MEFKTVSMVESEIAALVEAIVATKGTLKCVVITNDEDPKQLPTIVKGVRNRLRKLNLGLSTEAGEGYVRAWTTGEPPKARAKDAVTEA